MKLLDKLLIDEFVQQVKATLTADDGEVLAICHDADTWDWSCMTRPINMNWSEFNAYSKAVGGELVLQEILIGHNPLRLRLSKKWYNENRKGEDK